MQVQQHGGGPRAERRRAGGRQSASPPARDAERTHYCPQPLQRLPATARCRPGRHALLAPPARRRSPRIAPSLARHSLPRSLARPSLARSLWTARLQKTALCLEASVASRPTMPIIAARPAAHCLKGVGGDSGMEGKWRGGVRSCHRRGGLKRQRREGKRQGVGWGCASGRPAARELTKTERPKLREGRGNRARRGAHH